MRVYNERYGFGTVEEKRGEFFLVRWDCDPWFPMIHRREDFSVL